MLGITNSSSEILDTLPLTAQLYMVLGIVVGSITDGRLTEGGKSVVQLPICLLYSGVRFPYYGAADG